MNIYLNNEQINFILEDERTIGDVITSLESWLHGESYSITGIVLDGQSLEIPIGSVDMDRMVDGVEELRVSAESNVESQYDKLSTIYEYFCIFLKSVEDDDEVAIREVLTEVPFVTSAIDGILGNIPSGEGSQSDIQDGGYAAGLIRLIDNSGIANGPIQGEPKKTFAVFLESIISLVRNRMLEISSPLLELRSTVEALINMVPNLGEVSILLQTGEDREAMNRVIAFAELSQKLLRLYTPLRLHGILESEDIEIGNESIRDYYVHTNELLNELTEAFENNDSVLIGDLLEYEIGPKLEALSDLVDSIEGASE